MSVVGLSLLLPSPPCDIHSLHFTYANKFPKPCINLPMGASGMPFDGTDTNFSVCGNHQPLPSVRSVEATLLFVQCVFVLCRHYEIEIGKHCFHSPHKENAKGAEKRREREENRSGSIFGSVTTSFRLSLPSCANFFACIFMITLHTRRSLTQSALFLSQSGGELFAPQSHYQCRAYMRRQTIKYVCRHEWKTSFTASQ